MSTERRPEWLVRRVASFRYAFAGLFHLIRTQRNAQIHVVAAVLVIVFGMVFQISRPEWLALAIIITLVIAAEGVNTAVEAAVDLASPHHHPLARVAKDVAAGTVLITAFGAVAVGVIVFWPHVWPALVSVVR